MKFCQGSVLEIKNFPFILNLSFCGMHRYSNCSVVLCSVFVEEQFLLKVDHLIITYILNAIIVTCKCCSAIILLLPQEAHPHNKFRLDQQNILLLSYPVNWFQCSILHSIILLDNILRMKVFCSYVLLLYLS